MNNGTGPEMYADEEGAKAQLHEDCGWVDIIDRDTFELPTMVSIPVKDLFQITNWVRRTMKIRGAKTGRRRVA